ncbi:hypothetical protein Cgig2_016491 [Carnegiea gigantea]|uniref:DUF8040 domain-containing protein n=1 Tax=Carnegiea gigantea TaxID=171969 RepID=A0A9Q1JL53_9CARY|nr:hypothetical protein Cgig2_016491 [Carnegiea gigantea]
MDYSVRLFNLKWGKKIEKFSANTRPALPFSALPFSALPSEPRPAATAPLLLPDLTGRRLHLHAPTEHRRRRLRPVPAPQTATVSPPLDRLTKSSVRVSSTVAIAPLLLPELTGRRLHLHAPTEDQPPTSPAGTGAIDRHTVTTSTHVNCKFGYGTMRSCWMFLLNKERKEPLMRVILKNEGIHEESAQIKNRCNDIRKKLGAWEYLIGRTGVGVDYTIGAVDVSYSAWQEFLERYGGKCKSFRKKMPANLDKMKSAFHGKQATGEMSFAPGMVGSPSNQTQRSKGKAIDFVEHVGDSDETNEDGSDDDIECFRAEESRSPPKTVHSSHKRKSEGGTSSDGKRQALLNWSAREEEVNQAFAFLRITEKGKQQPSLTKQVQARLKQHPEVSAMGTDFIWSVMDYIYQKKEENLFLDLDDEFVVRYIKSRGMDEDDCTMDKEDCTMDEVEDQAIDTVIGYALERYLADRPRSTFKERMPTAIGGGNGAQYIHRLLSRNHPNLHRKVLRLEKDTFTHLVSIFIERGLLEEGRFVKAAEIVAMTLFRLARGASYQEAEDRFQHSPSTIGKYHKQVLHGLVQLSSDIVRSYQSQDEVPAEILQKNGFY